MRFALLGPVYPYRGGIAHYTTQLDKMLRQQGHETLLVSFRRQYPRWLFPGASDRDPSRQPLPGENAHYWLDSLNPLTWLTSFTRIRRFGPQVFVLQWWTTFWAPVWLTLALLNTWFLRAQLVFICHNVLPHDARGWERWIARLVLGRGARFIVQSEEERGRLMAHLPRATITVVPMPVFNMFSGQKPPKDEARRRLHLPQDATVLLFFGIVRPYKGLGDLIEALPVVRRERPSLHLVIAGEFWEDKAAYLQRIRQLGLEAITHIDDRYIPNEEVGLYFAAADLVAALYRQQTGSAVAELATGFGVPVLTSAMLPAHDTETGEASTTNHARPVLIAAAINTALAEGVPQPCRTQNDDEASWLRLVQALEGTN